MKAPAPARNPGASTGKAGRALMPYLARLWRGELPLNQVFFNDMLIAGTILNVVTLGLSLALFAAGVPRWVAGLVFFSPLPYNVFVFVGVWRSARIKPSHWSRMVRMVAVAWLAAMFLI
jgi:hypothetical protein